MILYLARAINETQIPESIVSHFLKGNKLKTYCMIQLITVLKKISFATIKIKKHTNTGHTEMTLD